MFEILSVIGGWLFLASVFFELSVFKRIPKKKLITNRLVKIVYFALIGIFLIRVLLTMFGVI